MNKQTETTDMEFCKTCGTMLLMGICRRCTPDTKPISAINAARSVKKRRANTLGIHGDGVRFASEMMNDNAIKNTNGPGHGVDIVMNNGKTALVRAYSKPINRAFLIRKDISDLKTDFLIIVTNLECDNDRDIYIIPIQHAKNVAENYPDSKTGEDNVFINMAECHDHINKYASISGV